VIQLGDRSLFPTLEPPVYLNHAAISPPSVPVQDAARRYLDDYATRGVGAVMEWMEERVRLRSKFARLLGGTTDDYVLVPSTSHGIITVATCFPWVAGDRVVCFYGEFPGNVTPWQRAADRFGLELLMLPQPVDPDGAPDLTRIEAALQRGVRMIAISAVQFQTGVTMPLAELGVLCSRYDCQLFVDGVQAAGVVPMDLPALGVDYFASGGHKWLMGLPGCGVLYVAPSRAAALEPALAGWLSHESALDFLFEGPGLLRYDKPVRRTADALCPGLDNGIGAAALSASLDCLLALSVERIAAHVGAWLDALQDGLQGTKYRSVRPAFVPARSGILSIVPPGGQTAMSLSERLAAHGVSCSTPDGLLRIAPHWPNNQDEVSLVLKALAV
jgi:cysteine desulfurase / selenocysteine lyase